MWDLSVRATPEDIRLPTTIQVMHTINRLLIAAQICNLISRGKASWTDDQVVQHLAVQTQSRRDSGQGSSRTWSTCPRSRSEKKKAVTAASVTRATAVSTQQENRNPRQYRRPMVEGQELQSSAPVAHHMIDPPHLYDLLDNHNGFASFVIQGSCAVDEEEEGTGARGMEGE